jgi:DegV family protein with EDD domain
MTVAIVTDSGSDLTPTQLRENSIRQVPLSVSIGDRSYLSPDELTAEEFWRLMRTPGCPVAHTAAPSAGQFKQAFELAFEDGADGIVCVCLSETLSGTIASARMAREMLPGREIHIVDSRSACMAIGALALRGATMAAHGAPAVEIAAEMNRLRRETTFFVALDTLDYLRKGGRISPARAAVGGLLSVKPIITIEEGIIITADQPRTRTKALARVSELIEAQPATEIHFLYSPPADVGAFREAVLARMPEPAPKLVTAQVIGPVIGTHVGPGAYGAALVLEGRAVEGP